MARAVFSDQEGRSWSATINVKMAKRLKERLGLDVMTAFEGKLFSQLAGDPIMLGDTLYVVCQEQAAERGITDEQFGELLAGDTIERATDALIEGLVDFFPGARRQILGKVWTKQKQADGQVTQAAIKRIDSSAMDQLIQQAVSEVESGLDLAMKFGAGFGDPLAQ